MPPTDKHIEQSEKRTGNGYVELHQWIDDAEKKYERHDFTKIWQFGPEIKNRFGEAGVQEYIEHLREDMQKKFDKLRQNFKEEDYTQALRYFGIEQQ